MTITDIQKLNSAFGQSADELRMFVSETPVSIAMFDRHMRYIAASKRWYEDYRIEHDDVTGLSHYEVFPEISDSWKAIHQRCLQGAIERCDEEAFTRKDGKIDWLRWEIRPWHDRNSQIGGIIILTEDITGRKQAEFDLLRSKRTLQVLSRCNHALLHTNHEFHLLNEICRIIVETGNYRMAWVGYAEKDKHKTVRPIAHWGFEEGYIETLNITWADEERGRGPTGTAIRTGKSSIARNIHTDPRFSPWRKAALKRGYASSIGIPLIRGDEAFGALMIYATEANAFNTEECQLLENLAENLSYGIMTLRTEAERTRIENKLKQSEEHLRFLYEENPSMYFTIASDGTVLSVNEFGANELGYTVSELTGNSFLNIFPRHQQENAMNHLKACLENFGQLQFWEIQKIRRTGEMLWVKETARAVGTPEGGTAVLIVCRDNTERKHVEEQLLLRNQSIEAATNAIMITDPKQPGNPIIYCNPAVEKITGYSRLELIGQNPAFLRGHDSNQPELVKISEAIREGHEVRAVVRNYRKDGTLFWNELYISPVRNTDNTIIYWISIQNDITEQKQLHDIMQKNDQRLRNAQRIAHIGFWEWKIDSDFVYWSDEVYRIFGIQPGTFKGTYESGMQLVHPDDRKIVDEQIRKSLKEGVDFSIDHRIILPDNNIRYVKEHGEVSYDESGAPVKMVGTITDITDLKKADEEIRYSHERLRNLAIRLQAIREEERARIAREIHDELGQTLTGLKIDLVWVRQHLTQDLGLIPDRVDSMISLVDDKLDDTRRLAFRIRPAMLDDLGLEAAIECEVQDFAERAGIQYSLDVNNVVIGKDRDRDTAVFRILQEALTNVARHAQADRIDVALNITNSKLVLTVTDNGVGIDQIKMTGTESLGLMGMQERASALGGYISVLNGKEGGTQVTVSMPMSETRI